MNAIDLTGLPTRHPAACLATYGMSSVLECGFSFTGPDGHAVLHTPMSLGEVAAALANPATWRAALPHEVTRLLYAKKKKGSGDDPEKDAPGITVETFQVAAAADPWWAFGIGTDHVRKLNKDKVMAPDTTSFQPAMRNDTLSGAMNVWVEAVLRVTPPPKVVKPKRGQPAPPPLPLPPTPAERVAKILTCPRWDYAEEGKNFMIFPELPSQVQFRGSVKMRNVPILNLLAFCHWKNCQTYRLGEGVGTPGWFDDDVGSCLVCPIPEVPTSRRTLMSWLLNAHLMKGGTQHGRGCPRTLRFRQVVVTKYDRSLSWADPTA